jgi:protein involved in sex pheromone biosynthesis
MTPARFQWKVCDMEISIVLIGAMIGLTIVSVYFHIQSRREVRKLRATLDLMKANQSAVITQSQLLREQLVRETDELNDVVIRLHKQNSQFPSPA